MNTIDDIVLMQRLMAVANERFDGHLTILKFTTKLARRIPNSFRLRRHTRIGGGRHVRGSRSEGARPRDLTSRPCYSPRMSNLIRLDRLGTGVILSAPRGLVEHFVMITDDRSRGILRVIGTSPPRGVGETPAWYFHRGQVVRIHGYPGELPPEEVMARARSLIGMQYDAGNANCEHFVRWCHGLEPESPQLQQWLTVGAIALGAYLLSKAA
jgi:hypothetical protein